MKSVTKSECPADECIEQLAKTLASFLIDQATILKDTRGLTDSELWFWQDVALSGRENVPESELRPNRSVETCGGTNYGNWFAA